MEISTENLICNIVRMPSLDQWVFRVLDMKIMQGHSIKRHASAAVLRVAQQCWPSRFIMARAAASLSFNYLNYSKNMMDTYTTELIFYWSNAPHMFNNVKLMLHIGLTRIQLHICVPEKKCYKVIWTYPSQRHSFLVGLSIDWQVSIQWQQKNAFSVALSRWRRKEKLLRTKR